MKCFIPKIVSFCNKEIHRVKNIGGLRVSEQDYYSIALTDVLMRLVNDFNPEQQRGFMRLYYYRVSIAFKSLFNKYINNKNKALVTGLEFRTEYFNKSKENLINIDVNIEELLNEFVKINPKGNLLFAYMLNDREQRTKEIMEELDIKEYSNTNRWKVHNIKNQFRKFIIDSGYNCLVA